MEMGMESEIQKLKKYLEESRRDCVDLRQRGCLTPEGEGILSYLNAIFQHMGWEMDKNPLKVPECLTVEEGRFWESALRKYRNLGYLVPEARKLADRDTKTRFPRLMYEEELE